MMILQIQQGMVQHQGGVQGPLVYAHNIYDTVERITANAGFKESFFTDPSAPPPQGAQPQQPKPDPAMMQAQAKMQSEMAMGQAKMEAVMRKSEVDAMIAQIKAQAQLQLEQEKARNDIVVSQMRESAKAQREAMEIQMRAASGAYTVGDTQPKPNGNGNGGAY